MGVEKEVFDFRSLDETKVSVEEIAKKKKNISCQRSYILLWDTFDMGLDQV